MGFNAFFGLPFCWYVHLKTHKPSGIDLMSNIEINTIYTFYIYRCLLGLNDIQFSASLFSKVLCSLHIQCANTWCRLSTAITKQIRHEQRMFWHWFVIPHSPMESPRECNINNDSLEYTICACESQILNIF